MLSNNEIRMLYSKYGNKKFDLEQHCIGCFNCTDFGFPCLNCADHVFDFKLGVGNPEELVPNPDSPLDIFRSIYYDENEIKQMIPNELNCPDVPKKQFQLQRSNSTGTVCQLQF